VHRLLVLGRLFRWSQATGEFERLRDLTNDDPPMMSSCAGLLMGQGDMGEAEGIYFRPDRKRALREPQD